MKENYDALAKIVNASYAETEGIHQTMNETRLPFYVVWEKVGLKEEMDI